jgi:hypothetical protein
MTALRNLAPPSACLPEAGAHTAEGREQERREAIVRLVWVRFRTVPPDLPARLANLDTVRLNLLLDKAEFAESLEEFLAMLQ